MYCRSAYCRPVHKVVLNVSPILSIHTPCLPVHIVDLFLSSPCSYCHPVHILDLFLSSPCSYFHPIHFVDLLQYILSIHTFSLPVHIVDLSLSSPCFYCHHCRSVQIVVRSTVSLWPRHQQNFLITQLGSQLKSLL